MMNGFICSFPPNAMYNVSAMTMKPLKTCPICSSRRIHKVRRTFSQTIAGREIRVPNVECYECPNCGQRIYDPAAADKVLAAAPQRRRRAVA
jgi:YgiT-type zinc finger domain-containing protein